MRCDLSDLDDVRALGAQLAHAHPRVHALVDNAGVLPTSRVRTRQGLELAFATNVLAGFALTEALRGSLEAAGTAEDPARIITMSSGGMYTQRLDLRLLQDEDTNAAYDGIVAYAQTKRAQVILNGLLAAVLGPTVACAAVHPGWARTPGVATSLPTFNRVMGPFLRSPAEGADTMVWLVASMASLAHLKQGQRFFRERAPRPEHLRAGTREDDATRRALWELCARLCARRLFWWVLPPMLLPGIERVRAAAAFQRADPCNTGHTMTDKKHDIVETAAAAGTFKTLAAALTAADLVSTLKGAGPFTVFAPTDEAFGKIAKKDLDALLADKAKLKAVLLHHVVAGNVLAADVVKMVDGAQVKTAGGTSFTLGLKGDKVSVDASGVTATDVHASNGTIHIIDTVMIPK